MRCSSRSLHDALLARYASTTAPKRSSSALGAGSSKSNSRGVREEEVWEERPGSLEACRQLAARLSKQLVDTGAVELVVALAVEVVRAVQSPVFRLLQFTCFTSTKERILTLAVAVAVAVVRGVQSPVFRLV